MSDILPETSGDITTDAIESAFDAIAPGGPAATALTHALAAQNPTLTRAAFCGAVTPQALGDPDRELAALLHTAGVYDLGWRGRIEVHGEDRVRWLNGMLTNNTQALADGQGNYNFVLNAQGRIQGDCDAIRLADRFVLHTALAQVPTLLAHFDRYIIMDDVELRDAGLEATALGVAGPQAPAVLKKLGVEIESSSAADIRLSHATVAGVPVQLLQFTGGSFELQFPPEHALSLWNALLTAGAAPAGLTAVESLRVFEGRPLYGVDIGDRDLPQETAQARALNFTKGCYLGQEIVERIRSRATVHRRLGRFLLSSLPARLPLELHSNGQLAGRITSAARVEGPVYGLGIARVETVERKQPLEYEGGTAAAAEQPFSGTSPAPIS